ncbi:SecY-interacting protein, partial [Salmonella enterica]|nr:SecY-interacting protein [Salmonella enterica]
NRTVLAATLAEFLTQLNPLL